MDGTVGGAGAGAGAGDVAAAGARFAVDPGCDVCVGLGGEVLFQHRKLRVVLVDDPLYPGFCRVIWQEHAREMTDLLPAERSLLMTVVCKVEQAQREVMEPHKINLASLGNMTPHVHWHVIPRYADDAHFPQPVWGQWQRTTVESALAARRDLVPALRTAIAMHCAGLAA